MFKFGQSARVACVASLAAISLASPSFLTTTDSIVAWPGLTNELAICVAGLGCVLAVRGSTHVSERASVLLSLAGSSVLVALQVLALALRPSLPWWEYVSALGMMAPLDQSLRAFVLMGCVLCLSRSIVWSGEAGYSRSVLGPMAMCFLAGISWFAFSWAAPDLFANAEEGFSANVMSLCVWVLSALCFSLVAFAALGLGSCVHSLLAIESFLGGLLVSAAVCRFVDVASMGHFADDARLGSLAGGLLALSAFILPFVALIWVKKHCLSSSAFAEGGVRTNEANAPLDYLAAEVGSLPGYEALSLRECEVLLLDVSGAKTADMASELGISRSSIGTHRERAYEKLGVVSRQELLGILFDRAHLDAEGVCGTGRADIAKHALRKVILALIMAIGALMASYVLPSWLVACVVILSSAAATITGFVQIVMREDEAGTISEFQLSGLLAATALVGSFASLLSASSGSGVVMSLVALVLSCVVLSDQLRDALLCNSFAWMTCGYVGLAVVLPVSPHSATRLCTLALLVLCSALALLAKRSELSKRRAGLADCALSGKERAKSYLMGRGLSELEADVALLASLGFDSESSAKRLHVSVHTVASYRTRAYTKLSLSDKVELRALLREEAGLE